MEKELTRETVDPRYTWDLTRIYASDEAWEEAFADVKAQAEAFAKRAGTLSHGREAVLDALAAMMRMDETFFALHAYAMMKNNEDSTNAKYQAMSDRAGTLAGVVAAGLSLRNTINVWIRLAAANRRAFVWRACCCKSRICSCWMNRPTTSTWRPCNGLKTIWPLTRAACW